MSQVFNSDAESVPTFRILPLSINIASPLEKGLRQSPVTIVLIFTMAVFMFFPSAIIWAILGELNPTVKLCAGRLSVLNSIGTLRASFIIHQGELLHGKKEIQYRVNREG